MYRKRKEKSKKYNTYSSKAFRVLFVLLIFSGLFSGTSAADDTVFNVDFFCGWSGYFRPMEWTPVEITVGSNLESTFDGELTLTTQQDGLNTLNIVHKFVLYKDMPSYMPLVTKIAFSAQKCSLKLDQKDGKRRKTVWNHDFDVYRFITPGKLAVLNEQDILVGVVGMGKFGLLRLDKQAYSQYQGMTGKVCIGTKQPTQVPWDWTGFVSLDLLESV